MVSSHLLPPFLPITKMEAGQHVLCASVRTLAKEFKLIIHSCKSPLSTHPLSSCRTKKRRQLQDEKRLLQAILDFAIARSQHSQENPKFSRLSLSLEQHQGKLIVLTDLFMTLFGCMLIRILYQEHQVVQVDRRKTEVRLLSHSMLKESWDNMLCAMKVDNCYSKETIQRVRGRFIMAVTRNFFGGDTIKLLNRKLVFQTKNTDSGQGIRTKLKVICGSQ